ncbi:MAG: hypothetical protein ACYS7Y_27340 [Planctomycetota bacterium]|jgi:hypothetical protein
MMNALDLLVDSGLSDDALDAVLLDLLENDAFDDDADKLCCIALAWSRDNGDKTGPSDCVYERDDTVSISGSEYLVLTDDEADAAFDAYLESMLDDEGIVPGGNGPYFDRAAWKKDAAIDGRGHSLGCYDGYENDYSVKCNDTTEWYYLYRIS